MAKIIGLYRGVVEDNKDPENRGRCKVRIFGVNPPNQSIDNLYWAEPLAPFGGNETINYLFVPPIGATVLVGFINNEEQQPVILGYWRKQSFDVLEDYSEIYDKKHDSFLYIKFGAKETSPYIKFNSATEKVYMGTKENEDEIGGSRGIFAEAGNSLLNLFKKSVVLKFNKHRQENYISLSKEGINIYTDASQKHIVKGNLQITIGSGLAKKFPDPTLENMGLFDFFAGKFPSIPSIKDIFGNELFKKISNVFGSTTSTVATVMQGGYRISKSVFQNLMIFAKSAEERKKILQAIAQVPSQTKDFVVNFLKQKGNLKDIKKQLTEKLKQALDIFKNKPFEQITKKESFCYMLNVQGNSKILVLGKHKEQVRGAVSKIYSSDYSLSCMGKLDWNITKDFGILISTGDFKWSLGKGNVECVFMVPTSKFTIKQATPIAQSEVLVKKTAFKDLWAYVSAIARYLTMHMHIGNMGAPTSPPTLPQPFAPTMTQNELKLNLKDLIPAPANKYYTNNLEVS